MQDFMFGQMKAQEAAPEPYILYDKEKSLEEPRPEAMTLRDFEYFKSMYPARVKEVQLHVEAVCDEMEYQGSPLYDEYPDRFMVEQLRKKVEERLEKEAAAQPPQEAIIDMEEAEPMETYEAKPVRHLSLQPRTSYGPAAFKEDGCGCQVCGTEAAPRLEEEEEQIQEVNDRHPGGPPPRPANPWGPPPPRPGNPWGPPPPPPRPANPWGPPPPPPRPANPWGPPPPPRPGNPWGPPPPPPRPENPWGPPPPPPRPENPWGPPPPPPRPGSPWGPPPPPRPNGRVGLDDLINLLLFGEMQHRRCRHRHCR